jgi:hypothetical protein
MDMRPLLLIQTAHFHTGGICIPYLRGAEGRKGFHAFDPKVPIIPAGKTTDWAFRVLLDC